MYFKFFIFLLTSVSSGAFGANILAYFFVPSVSHQYVFQPIWRELSLRGHNVTVITPNPLKDPKLTNLTEIDETTKISDIVWTYHEASKYINHIEMSQEDVKIIMEKPEHSFDLILLESHNLIGYGLQHKFKAPLVAISSLGLTFYTHYIFGNPVHPVLYPDLLSEIHGKLSLWQKFDSLYVALATWWTSKFYVVPDANRIAQTYFGTDMPYIEDLVKKSLIFGNVNPIFASRRPSVPNFMEFSNIHLVRRESLSKKLQTRTSELTKTLPSVEGRFALDSDIYLQKFVSDVVALRCISDKINTNSFLTEYEFILNWLAISVAN